MEQLVYNWSNDDFQTYYLVGCMYYVMVKRHLLFKSDTKEGT